MKTITTMIAMLCVTLAAREAFSADGGERMGARAGIHRPREFNVLDYGAVGDDRSDNTAAFSACLEAIMAAGGGRMVIPEGVYRGRIIIPGTRAWITIEIVGASEPTPIFGTIGAFSLPTNGTIVKCLAESGPAVISALNTPETMYQTFSGVYVILRNLEVRTYDNPGIGGIDLRHAAQCKLENVVINTGCYNVQASKPTHEGAIGLITPALDNGAQTILRNVVVTGYFTGIQVHEHTDGDNIVVASNINGLEFCLASHASRFGRVGAYRNTNHLTVSGAHAFTIEQLNTEMPGAGQTNAENVWQTLVSDIHDPKNLGVGDINYWVTLGAKGPVESFVKIGGASIRARRIGSAP
jgi:hypothetical protein